MIPLLVCTSLVIVLLILIRLAGVVRYISNSQVGIVEKLFGSRTLSGAFIALHEETGFQPEILRGGFHCFLPFQYRVHTQPLVTIPQGSIGYVFARDGQPLAAGQTLAFSAGADFQDVRTFLSQGGQKGPQRAIMREGTYAMNLAQFLVVTRERTYGMILDDSEKLVVVEKVENIAEEQGLGSGDQGPENVSLDS